MFTKDEYKKLISDELPFLSSRCLEELYYQILKENGKHYEIIRKIVFNEHDKQLKLFNNIKSLKRAERSPRV
jgi:hypothetical protein